jgi:hypothetical protein
VNEGRFIPVSDRAAWQSATSGWPADAIDIYFSAGYHEAFAAAAGLAAVLYAFGDRGERFLYPFVISPIDRVGEREIPGGYSDIETVYGFCGPLATTTDPAFLAAAWQRFDDWCRARHVVAEFMRLNPLLRNERFCPASMTTSVVREHVVLDLTQTEEAIWKGYSSINRNMIRKAEKSGVGCRIVPFGEVLPRFVELYHATMDRNVAGDSYYFTAEQFGVLERTTPCFACVATIDDRVEAVSLFLDAGPRVHYHLSGCSAVGLKVAASNLILHTVVLEARRRLAQVFHFGGGRTGAPDDSLLKFKSNFSRERLPVLIGRRVHDSRAYGMLCDVRRSQVAEIPQGYFLAYRYEPASRTHA